MTLTFLFISLAISLIMKTFLPESGTKLGLVRILGCDKKFNFLSFKLEYLRTFQKFSVCFYIKQFGSKPTSSALWYPNVTTVGFVWSETPKFRATGSLTRFSIPSIDG